MARNSSQNLQRSLSNSDGFSFAKASRFRDNSATPGFYEIERSLDKRGSLFGSEKRPELFPVPLKVPGPGEYSPSHVQKHLAKIISPSHIGERSKLSKNNSPGPGSYSISRDAIGPKFTFQKKYLKKEPEVTPSGANYNPNFSYISRSKFSQIGFGYGQKTDPTKGKISPGPGSYSIPTIFPKIKKETTQLFQVK